MLGRLSEKNFFSNDRRAKIQRSFNKINNLLIMSRENLYFNQLKNLPFFSLLKELNKGILIYGDLLDIF